MDIFQGTKHAVSMADYETDFYSDGLGIYNAVYHSAWLACNHNANRNGIVYCSIKMAPMVVSAVYQCSFLGESNNFYRCDSVGHSISKRRCAAIPVRAILILFSLIYYFKLTGIGTPDP